MRTPLLLLAAVALVLPGCSDEPAAAAPAVEAADWVLGHLADDGEAFDHRAIRRRFAPELLEVMPPEAFVDAVRGTVAERGPLRFVRYEFPPLERYAVALVRGDGGSTGALHVRVDGEGAIIGVDFTEAPKARPRKDADTGWFETRAGRRLFLHCTGEGPVVVLDGGVWHDWEGVRARLDSAPVTVCAFDRPSAFGSASSPVPTPRTGRAHVDDLRAGLRSAGVTGPYVVVGHSNSGLFSQVWAVTRPREVAAMVLVDPVTHDYPERRIAALRGLIPDDQLAALEREATQGWSPVLDPEQLDLAATQRDLARRWRRPLDLRAVVLSHGRPSEYPPGWPVAAEEELFRALHRDLAARFRRGELVVVPGAGHDIHLEAPGAVAEAIVSVLP